MHLVLRALAMLSLIASLCGCGVEEEKDVEGIGRYHLRATESGFEVHEKAGLLQRLLALVRGRPAEPKLRVTQRSKGSRGVPAETIARVIVRKRVVRGPEAKSPFKRPWEIRLVNREEVELPAFFHLRYEAEAEALANALRAALSSLRTRRDDAATGEPRARSDRPQASATEDAAPDPATFR
jgi:hypothetical protein